MLDAAARYATNDYGPEGATSLHAPLTRHCIQCSGRVDYAIVAPS